MFSLSPNTISLSPNDKITNNKLNKTKNISKKFGRPDLWTSGQMFLEKDKSYKSYKIDKSIKSSKSIKVEWIFIN